MLKLLLVVALFALATYVAVRFIERRTARPAPGRGAARRPVQPPPRRPLGPDDDPDFLRDLERKRRHPDDPEA